MVEYEYVMKTYLFLLLFLCCGIVMYAQIENTLPALGGNINNTVPSGLSGGILTSEPESSPLLHDSSKKLGEYDRNEPNFNMKGNTGFFEPEIEKTPKWFTKDKEIKEAYKSDQYFGDFKSKGEFVRLLYRDHEYVDGDVVRIYLNDTMIVSKVFLGGDFKGIGIDLIKGFNKIDIEALNQGESGPNTAEFQLYDDRGSLITSNEWNLTTGVKATLIVVKE